jgi:hypothetical protein
MHHLLIAIALNAVPLVGVWKFGWSAATVLLLFWLESLLGHAGAMIKIGVHARATHKRGHGAYSAVDGKSATGSYFAHFSTIAISFTLVHGVFLIALIFMMAHNRPELTQFQVHWDSLKHGGLIVLGLVLLDLAMDLPGLHKRSFFWLETHTGKRLARVLVLHLTIIFGFAALAMSDSPVAFLMVFLLLKTLVDAGTSMSGDHAAIDSGFPEQPPKLLRFIDSKTRNRAPGKESLDAYWARSRAEALARRHRHEETMPGRGVKQSAQHKAE